MFNAHEFLDGALMVGGLGIIYASMDYLNFIPKFGYGDIPRVFDTTLKNVNLNIHNKNNETFRLKKIKKLDNGYYSEVIVPLGLSIEQLEPLTQMLKEHLYKEIEIKTNNRKHFIYFYNIETKIDFRPCETDSNRYINIGLELNNKPCILDLNVEPHFLIMGTTGTGKSTLMFTILTNLIYNYKNDYDIYLMQIVNAELSLFTKCKGVKGCYNSLFECLDILNKIEAELDKRKKLFSEHGAKDFNNYNKYSTKKLKRKFIFIDEFSFFRAEQSDDSDTINIKNEIESILLRVIKSGRANGVHIISCLQRATVDNVNTTIRSQVTMVSFKLKRNDSKLLFNDDRAFNLRPHEFYMSGQRVDSNYKSYYVDDELKVLKKYVNEIKIFNGATTNIIEKNESKKRVIKETTTVLPPMTVVYKNGKLFIDGVEQMQENKKEVVKTVSQENKILNFIEKYRAISTTQCAKLFYKNSSQNSRRALKELEEKEKIYKYKIDKYAVYSLTGENEIKMHELLRNDFLVNFLSIDYIEVREVKTEHKILNGLIRADMYIKYVKDKELKHLYIEVDDTHYTNDKKLKLYEEQLKVHTFDLVVIRKNVNEFKKYQYDIISLDPKKYTLTDIF